jgi:hypothetical protein
MAAAMTALAIGCSDSGPKLVRVTGVVTHNGKPLEGAVISFHPDPSNKEGKAGEDVTGPDGDYMARTDGRSGLVPGKYHVQVTKLTVDASKTSEAFKEDPFMAQLSSSGPEVGKEAGKNKSSKDKLEGAFDCEIPPEGGPQNFDVKPSASEK